MTEMKESNRSWRSLLCVERPGRYMAQEWNCVVKDPADCLCRMVLAFPDVYEIGMSYHGFRILYERINSRGEFAAERVFAPWKDAEELLRKKGEALCSLETGSPLSSFDIIGFTLQHELSYTNILTMLDLGKVPLLSSERNNLFPLVIGGGQGALSPEPLAMFFDAFIIGDGEEIALEILDLAKEYKARNKTDKKEFLLQLSQIPGVYAPSFYTPQYGADHVITGMKKEIESAPEIIRPRRYNIADDPGPVCPIVPLLRITQERLTIEVRRGCANGCRFCQAGMINRPVRERPVSQVLEITRKGIPRTGFEEISLLALSTADYSRLSELTAALTKEFSPLGVNISLPSIRINSCDVDVLNSLHEVRKSGLTLAPEAGTTRLRNVINKPVDDDTFFHIVNQAFASGRQTLKLYFMIGLPTETTKDLDGIVYLLQKAENIARKTRGRNYQINVTISPFVPKSHTPFQWAAQPSQEALREKVLYLRQRIKSRHIVFKTHNLDQSRLEAVFSRGDRRLGQAILRAWELGSRFDNWEENSHPDLWQQAFRESNIDPDFYANRERGADEVLPWDHISAGVTKDFLLKEWRKALSGELTPDCIKGQCHACGACIGGPAYVLATDDIPSLPPGQSPQIILGSQPVQRIRITYSKMGPICLISHLDLGKTLLSALKRARIPLVFTQGFNPSPKVQFGPPLSVGFESEGELIDIFLSQRCALKEIREKIEKEIPYGLKIRKMEEITLATPSLGVSAVAADYIIFPPFDLSEDFLSSCIIKLNSSEKFPLAIERKGKHASRDLKKSILKIIPLKPMQPGEKTGVEIRLSLKSEEYLDPRKALSCLLDHPYQSWEEWEVKRTKIWNHAEK